MNRLIKNIWKLIVTLSNITSSTVRKLSKSIYKYRDMKRDPQEVHDAFSFNVRMLEHLCSLFDKGQTEAALWIAVVLRALLYTKYDDNGNATSLSMIDILKEKDAKYDIQYLSTAFPMPKSKQFLMGWNYGDGICGTKLKYEHNYCGLIVKTLRRNTKGNYVGDVRPKWADHSGYNHMMNLAVWMKEIVFFNTEDNFSLSREEAIKMVSNKDGGAHFDSKVPRKYDSFRHPEMFTVYSTNGKIPFTKHPVYVTIRQIAWEVLALLHLHQMVFFKKGKV